MKPRTFTYNQMITFFQEIKLPLNEKQVHAIGILHRQEIDQLQVYKERQREKANEKYLKRLKRKEERAKR